VRPVLLGVIAALGIAAVVGWLQFGPRTEPSLFGAENRSVPDKIRRSDITISATCGHGLPKGLAVTDIFPPSHPGAATPLYSIYDAEFRIRVSEVTPLILYFRKPRGHTLRIFAVPLDTNATQNGSIYYIGLDGYGHTLASSGVAGPAGIEIFISRPSQPKALRGELSLDSCDKPTQFAIPLTELSSIPELLDRHPLKIGEGQWMRFSQSPLLVVRQAPSSALAYQYFTEPTSLTTKEREILPADYKQMNKDIGIDENTMVQPIERRGPE